MDTPEAPAGPPPFKKSVVREYLESIVVAVILALFIRTFVVQAFKIPTGSMETNLLIGDHLLVNKMVYSPSCGRVEQRLLAKKDIQRGHVVVFKFPEEPARDFIKRVIGLPGETVEIRNKASTSTARRIDEPATCTSWSLPWRPDDPEFGLRGRQPGQLGPGGGAPRAALRAGRQPRQQPDSRFWGFLPEDQVKGRALLVYWSYEATREEYHRTGYLEWIRDTLAAFGKTRWNRFFHLIR